jgi:hypothetical protein
MHRNQFIPRRYPVLNQIAQNDRKNSMESLLCHNDKYPAKRSEFVHATVEDDLIGPGHMRSRSRSRTREVIRRGPRSSSSSKPHSAAVRPGLEIHVPQRGRYIVVEDVRNARKRSSTPEFVLVNKENGRAIPLHSIYQNPQQPRPMSTFKSATPTDPPVDYDKVDFQQSQRRFSKEQMRKARSMSDLSDDGRYSRSPAHSASSFESPRQSSVTNRPSSLCLSVSLSRDKNMARRIHR